MTYKNYLSGLRVSDGWADHVARGSLGGIDYATGVGTPIPAPTDGRVENIPNNGSAGNTVTLWHPDGSRDQFLHLSKFVAPGNYRAGDTITIPPGLIHRMEGVEDSVYLEASTPEMEDVVRLVDDYKRAPQ